MNMSLDVKLNDMLKTAMKEKNKDDLNAIRNLKSAIKYEQIDKKLAEISDDLFLEVVSKQAKQRKDSINEFKKAGRNDLVDKETKELNFLLKFLPEQLTSQQLELEIKKIMDIENIHEKKDFGKLMKIAVSSFKNVADGNSIKEVVNKLLN